MAQAVRDVLQRMGEAGVHPREDTFNTLMEGALQNQDADLVPQLFQQLISLDLEPDSLSYTALITALARLSKPDVAVSPWLSILSLPMSCRAAICRLDHAQVQQRSSTERGCWV